MLQDWQHLSCSPPILFLNKDGFSNLCLDNGVFTSHIITIAPFWPHWGIDLISSRETSWCPTRVFNFSLLNFLYTQSKPISSCFASSPLTDTPWKKDSPCFLCAHLASSPLCPQDHFLVCCHFFAYLVCFIWHSKIPHLCWISSCRFELPPQFGSSSGFTASSARAELTVSLSLWWIRWREKRVG